MSTAVVAVLWGSVSGGSHSSFTERGSVGQSHCASGFWLLPAVTLGSASGAASTSEVHMSRHPQMYKMPRKPGYLGGYNWRASAMGLLFLVGVSWIATQFIARRFDYQPALGEPLNRVGRVSVYQPFSWVMWGWRYCTSQDERIRRPLFEGEMIVFAGSFLGVAFFFVLTNRRSRKLSENAEDLHGSARWAAEEDIRATGLLTSPQGVYVGGWAPDNSSRIHYLRHNGPEHVLAFAPTRSGKGVGLVIPTLLAWSESAIVYDIKGENWARTAGFRANSGHLCFKFSPVEPGNSFAVQPSVGSAAVHSARCIGRPEHREHDRPDG